MAVHQAGETIICEIEVTNRKTGVKVSPDTSMKISIASPSGELVVDGQAMNEDATGEYHYDHASADSDRKGIYKIEYEAIHSSRTTIETDTFTLE